MVDMFWGVVLLVVAAVLFWEAFTSKEFYAAFGRENPWQYSLWGGRIVTASLGILATFLGIMAIRQGLSGK
jgi:hypothetical protein